MKIPARLQWDDKIAILSPSSNNLAAQHDDSRIFGPISKDSIIGLVW